MQQILEKPFHFKQFSIEQDKCSMKLGTDGILLGAWAEVSEVSSILDIGTGTGVIAVMLAQRAQNASVHAVEIDEEACAQAQENMAKSPWNNRLKGFNVAIQDFAKNGSSAYDLIVSNPPFFTGGTFSENQDKNSVRNTIKLPHGDLLHAARGLLKEGGKFCTILPFLEGLRFKELAATYGLYCSKLTQVIPVKGKSVERLLLQFEQKVHPLVKEELVLKEVANGDWTIEYVSLTKDFYLNL